LDVHVFIISVSGGASPQTTAACQQHGRKISPIGGTQPAEHLAMRRKLEAVPAGNGVHCAKVVYRLASFDSSSDLGEYELNIPAH
uniref:ANF_receptor domain-containing protein n=1 Tax=Ascaris lumbricoides TaxID=6252 RepID=A0A0M3IEN7_ASCLU